MFIFTYIGYLLGDYQIFKMLFKKIKFGNFVGLFQMKILVKCKSNYIV